MAGPWFTVQAIEGGDAPKQGESPATPKQDGEKSWTTLDRVWLSNGKDDVGARVQLRLRLAPPQGLAAMSNTTQPKETR